MAQNQGSPTQLRDHYLQTLGIVQYIPKELTDEVVVDNSVEETPVTESLATENPVTKSPVQSVQTKSSQQSAIEALLQADAEDNSPKKLDRAVKPSRQAQQETSTLALQFVFWQPTDELLIATAADHQLPDSQQVSLLTKIVATIDNQLSGLPPFDVISWPPHASMQGGEQEAREFLSTLISSRLAAKSTKLLLILGESAQNWLLSSKQKTSVKDGLLPMTADATALIAPSLTEMLSQPQSKRLTWQVICQYFTQQKASS
ncbi:MAG: hypothetical protein P8J25_02385 [Porticoccaceae bacterium]|nr:hypothetical protein [Porticoccaceae bacterium]